MYPASNKFITAVNSNSRKHFWNGIITAKDGSVYNFENKDIIKGSGYISRQCSSSSEIEIGSVYAAELGITLVIDIDRYSLGDAEVKLFYNIELEDNMVETVPMGVFEISEANRNSKYLQIEAYDYMLRFDKNIRIEATSGKAFDFLDYACQECKVELAQSEEEIESLTNGKELLGIYKNNDIESYRDLIFYVAQTMACFCVINRNGKLELVSYSNISTTKIDAKQRYESSYSDFVTRYTAISSTNLIKEKTEYKSLEVDDGLTYNFGANPLLQFGLDETRNRILTNILNSISLINYVPFDSTTIGNPALELGDVLTFSGGNADEDKLSFITSITYAINGKHTLKCVGKNPKLAQAKSKSDKNISGLLNQVEIGKVVVYSFTNVSDLALNNKSLEVLNIRFTSKEETTAHFMAEILLEVYTNQTLKEVEGIACYNKENDEITEEINKAVVFKYMEKDSADLNVIYKLNSEEIDTFRPIQRYAEGKHVLTLFFPFSKVMENKENSFSVMLSIIGGSGKIVKGNIKATISGQGLVAGVSEWDGKINIEEAIKSIELENIDFNINRFIERLDIKKDIPNISETNQIIRRIEFDNDEFKIEGFSEKVSVKNIIKKFTMNKEYLPKYNKEFVKCENEVFENIVDYNDYSSSAAFGEGSLEILSIKTEDFEQIQNIEVNYDN